MPTRKYLLLKNGFTIIEFLIAMSLGTLLLSVLIFIYIDSEKKFDTQIKMGQVEEHARFTIEVLKEAIQKAGYIGCAQLTDDFPFITHDYFSLKKDKPVVIKDNAITLWKAKLKHANLTVPLQTKTELRVSLRPFFVMDEVLLLSDCKHAELLKVRSIAKTATTQIITTEKPLIYDYDVDAELSALEIMTFFIEETDRLSSNKKPIWALYLKNINNHVEELVEEIQALQFQFDEDKKGLWLKLYLSQAQKPWTRYIALN